VTDQVPDTRAKRRLRRQTYKATHAVQLYDGDIVGCDQGFRCFHFIKQGSKWTHLVEVSADGGEQRHRKCENDLWKKLLRKGWLLDHKGRKVQELR
jgi:hypothetical protein